MHRLLVYLTPTLLLLVVLPLPAASNGAVWPDIEAGFRDGYLVMDKIVTPYAGASLGSGDVDGDNHPDVVVGTTACVTWIVFGPLSASVGVRGVDDDDGALRGGRGASIVTCNVSELEFWEEAPGMVVAGDVNGDVNGDSVGDLLVFSKKDDWSSRSYQSMIHCRLVFGTAGSWSPSVDLSTGVHLHGDADVEYSSRFQGAALGDLNGDGIGDFIVCQTSDDPQCFVVYGSRGQWPTGDINGDKVPDLLLGCTEDREDALGSACVIFGGDTKSGSIDIGQPQQDHSGIKISSAPLGYALGQSISSAGDVDGDGSDDYVVGSPGRGPARAGAAQIRYPVGVPVVDTSSIVVTTGTGVSTGDVDGDGHPDAVLATDSCVFWIVFGPLNASLGVRGVGDFDGALADGRGIVVVGDTCDSDSWLWQCLVAVVAGDVNGDGIDDVAFSATTRGLSIVLFGRRNRTAWPQGVVGVNISAEDGFAIIGTRDTNKVSAIGDVNGDGLADVAVDKVVVFGSSTPALVNASAADFNGFAVSAEQWATLEGVGDVNGDGVDDLALGDMHSDNDRGRVTLIMGRAVFPRLVVPDRTANTTDIVGATGQSLAGVSVAGAGDVNGDSVGDLLVFATTSTYSKGTMLCHLLLGTAGAWRTHVDLSSEGVLLQGYPNSEALYGYSSYRGAAVGDINSDGVPDFAVCQNSSSGPLCSVVYGARGAWPRSIELREWSSQGRGFSVTAPPTNNGLITSYGQIITPSSGDLNGDAVPDLLLGIIGVSASSLGSNYIILGGVNRTGSFEVDSVASVSVNSVPLGYALGQSISCVGDANGDSLDDFLVGSPGRDPGRSGSAFLISGTVGGSLTHPIEWSLDFRCSTPGARCGSAVAGGGDVNGDGLSDFLIASDAGEGQVHVVYGSSTWYWSMEMPAVDLETPNETISSTITGDLGNATGIALTSLGDINGDGVSEVAIGVPALEVAYVVYGGASGLGLEVPLSQLSGQNGFQVTAQSFAGSDLGTSLASVDINGDGIADLAIGAPGSGAGLVFVLFGSGSNANQSGVDVSWLDGKNGFVIQGEAEGDRLGWSLSSAGDFNGDNVTDLVIGCMGSGASAPRAYVVFGRSGWWPAVVDLGRLSSTGAGTRVELPQGTPSAGSVVSSADDFNMDGVGDIALGAPDSGTAFVLFGSRQSWPSLARWRDLETRGFTVTGGPSSHLGSSLGVATHLTPSGTPALLLGLPTFRGIGAADVLVGGYEPDAGPNVSSAEECCSARVDVEYRFRLPHNVFTQPDGEVLFMYDVQPSWLQYDVTTRAFHSKMDRCNVGTVQVSAKARNKRGVYVSQQWIIEIAQSLNLAADNTSFACTVGSNCALPRVTVSSPGSGLFQGIVTFDVEVDGVAFGDERHARGTNFTTRLADAGQLTDILRRMTFRPTSKRMCNVTVVVVDNRGQHASLVLRVETRERVVSHRAAIIAISVCCAIVAVFALAGGLGTRVCYVSLGT
eukprot:m51a1_g12286 putative C-tail anchored protein, FG-GAP repeat (1482) ;mRNA; r:279940-288332